MKCEGKQPIKGSRDPGKKGEGSVTWRSAREAERGDRLGGADAFALSSSEMGRGRGGEERSLFYLSVERPAFARATTPVRRERTVLSRDYE